MIRKDGPELTTSLVPRSGTINYRGMELAARDTPASFGK